MQADRFESGRGPEPMGALAGHAVVERPAVGAPEHQASAPLIALGLVGANKLLAATFLVIVGTVAIYGLSATPLAGGLGLREPEP